MVALVMLVGTSAQAELTFYANWNDADGTLAGFDANLNVDSQNLAASDIETTLPLVADSGKFGKGLDCSYDALDPHPKGLRYVGNYDADNGRRTLANDWFAIDQGTIEFWVKPNWSGPEVPEGAGRRKLLTIRPANAGSWENLLTWEVKRAGDVVTTQVVQYVESGGSLEYIRLAWDHTRLIKDEWNHFALVWNTSVAPGEPRTGTSLYLNGIREDSTVAVPSWYEDSFIHTNGSYSGSTTGTADASYDDLAVWDEARYTGDTYTMPSEIIPDGDTNGDGKIAPAQAPKNVILFIGDGMGSEHVKAANYYNGGKLSFETFPYQGMLATTCRGGQIPDSASGATALATGVKVFPGMVSMIYTDNPDDEELETLLEYSADRDKATGLITTTLMTGTTPSAFGAHELSRNNWRAIAGDYLTQTRPNVLFGATTYMPPNPVGYTVVTDRTGMQALHTETATYVSGQFASEYLEYEYDGLDSQPHLREMTETALQILDNDPDGFFLMVEGAKIDHAAHRNDNPRAVMETIEFAKAVQKAIDWAAGRSDTLILVVADHETGGLTVKADNGPGSFPTVSWSTTTHTRNDIPIYGWGPNSHMVPAAGHLADVFDIATAIPDVHAKGNAKKTLKGLHLASP